MPEKPVRTNRNISGDVPISVGRRLTSYEFVFAEYGYFVGDIVFLICLSKSD
jgi:hypothetical protein